MLWSQFCSDISTGIKEISADSYVPFRYLYYEAQSIAADYLKKDNDAKRKLSRISEGWSELDCVDLEEIDVIQCADIDVRLCDKMMKSIHKIPETYAYSYGNLINYVASPNFAYFFEPTNPRQWNNIQKRQYKDKNKYYYFIIDNYIYLPIPKSVDIPIESLRIKGYFMDKREVDIFNNLKKCTDCNKVPEICKSPLDYEMVIPSYLINDVKMELLNRLTKTFVPIQSDPYPNLNESEKSNQKDLNNRK